MNRNLAKTGVLAGVSLYMFYTRHYRGKLLALHKDDAQVLSTEYCPPSKQKDGRAKVPESSAKDGPLVLQLQQVQVVFRHGARTPLHTTPRLSEVSYDSHFIMMGHQESMFPYKRVTLCGDPLEGWSKSEMDLKKRPLRGGSYSGQLSSYGKEQVYMLGQNLGDTYRERLDLCTYDPDEVRVISSNIARTVQSAQGVLAGFFGKYQLMDYAHCCGPVRIYTPDPCYNFLIPNVETCSVLKKTNYCSMLHPDCIPGYKDQRLEVEEHTMKRRESYMEAISEIQSKIDTLTEFYENDSNRFLTQGLNKHREHYLHDPMLQPLYDERAEAIQKLDRFWANIINREPSLQDTITTGDMRALVYLRDLKVEQFQGTITSGYRVHLYFDKNPFFHNTHLCKEVFTNENCPIPSKETPIKWKNGTRHLVQAKFKEEASAVEEKVDCKPSKCATPIPNCPQPVDPPGEDTTEVTGEDSFFAWFSQPTYCDSDSVGSAIIGDVWRKPLAVIENEPKVHDPWDNQFNFLNARDDITSRVSHGWWYPDQLRRYRNMVDKNATDIIFYSMTGQNAEVRKIVTRLSAGPLLTEMVDTARRKMCGEKSPRLCLYSTHDSTLVAVLEALRLWDSKWPPFACELRLELYRELNGCDYYVRLLYNGKVVRVRGQSESYMHWMDFCNCVKKYSIRKDEFERICRSNILERISQEKRKRCPVKETECD